MTRFESHKTFSGFSTTFRQWRAVSHCSMLHGYAMEFDAVFSAELDSNNWVADFGAFKAFKTQLSRLFDHTTVIAYDDPHLEEFQRLDRMKVIDLRIVNAVGCERFAELVLEMLQDFVRDHIGTDVRVESVTCRETTNNRATARPSR